MSSRFSWTASWPYYLLAGSGTTGLAQGLLAGPARSAVTLSALLAVPGALTISTAKLRRSVDPAAFGGLAAALGALWLAFAVVALNAVPVRITVTVEYAILLLACAPFAAVAQWRLRHADADGKTAPAGQAGP